MNEDPNIIQGHPEFPFGETLARDRLERWEESFEGRPDPDDPVASLLQEFLAYVERYAFLERIVQGEIRYELPVHPRFLEQRERSDEPLEQQAAELAEAEAELLGDPDVPSMEILDAIEDIGVKVLHAAGDPGCELVGAFFFEGETGPAFLSGVDPHDPRSAFVLAHLLGHYIADYDPYQNRVCRWDAESLENRDEGPDEARADLFARALLVPEESLRRYLGQLGAAASAGEAVPERSWEILSTLFGVPEPILADRMADIGFEKLAREMRAVRDRVERRVPANGARVAERPDGAGVVPRAGGFLLPSRYLNLALACFHERIMERDVLGQFLGTTEDETDAVIEWAEMGEGGRVGRAGSSVDSTTGEGGRELGSGRT